MSLLRSTPVDGQRTRAPSTQGARAHFVLNLSDSTFERVINSHDYVFVDFLAPWSVWDQRLAPIWEDFALAVRNQGHPLVVAKIDCTKFDDFCREQKIMAFPTLRFYQHGVAVRPDYKMDRTVRAFMHYAREHMDDALADDNHQEDHAGGVVNPEQEEGDDAVAEEKEEEEPPPHHEADLDMPYTCRSAGLGYGRPRDESQSDAGGDEFKEFNGLQVKVAPTCLSASSNARGKYNSFFAPCTFQFHVIPHAKQVRSSMQLSTECTSDNLYSPQGGINPEPIADYVRSWPDECVGDYSRCYAVSKESDKKIFLPHFCRNSWEIPSSVTHISVDCHDDKKEALRQQDMGILGSNPHAALMEKHHREKLVALLFIVLLLFCGCWAFLCLGYKYVVVPYLKAIKKSKSDADLQSLVAEN